MAHFDFEKMQAIQKELQAKYREKWTPMGPQYAKDKLLYMFIEAGEMADIIKKQGDESIMQDMPVREHFIEEMCDTLMYLNDVMLCYGISPEELEEVYLKKHEKNMKRW